MNTHRAEGMPPTSILSACQTLLRAQNVPWAISEVLSQIGVAAQVDRVYIFSIGGTTEATASQRYEWSSPNVDPQIDNPDLQSIPLRAAGYGRWIDEFSQCRPVVGTVAEFPEEEHHLLEAQGIRSLLVLPISVAQELWGFVGFDDCTRGRSWTTAEVDTLIAMSLALGIVLADGSHGRLEKTACTYIRVVGRLFDVHSVMFNEAPAVSLQHRAQVRLRVIARSYQYFSSADSSAYSPETVELHDYLAALKHLYQEVLGVGRPNAPAALDIEVDALQAAVQRSLDVALILGEVLAALAGHSYDAVTDSHILVAIHRRNAAVEITITGRSPTGVPVGRGDALDAMAVAVLREIQECCDATLGRTTIDGLLFRLTVPGVALPSGALPGEAEMDLDFA